VVCNAPPGLRVLLVAGLGNIGDQDSILLGVDSDAVSMSIVCVDGLAVTHTRLGQHDLQQNEITVERNMRR
jgi:hypothetical protein